MTARVARATSSAATRPTLPSPDIPMMQSNLSSSAYPSSEVSMTELGGDERPRQSRRLEVVERPAMLGRKLVALVLHGAEELEDVGAARRPDGLEHRDLAFGDARVHRRREEDVRDARHGRRPVSYTHLRAHETRHDLVCRL